MLDGVNCEKDHQRTYIITKKFIEKNIDDKNILATLKKTLIYLNMWNFKILKIQRIFQNCFKILELQRSLPHMNDL
jgi:hypothetical protein